MTWARSIRFAIILLALVQTGVWAFAGSVEWSFRDLLVGAGSSEAVANERFAIALFVGAAINLMALVPFLSGVRSGWLVLTLVQVVDALIAAAAALLVSMDWWLVIFVAGVTTLLLIAWRRCSTAVAI
jgi:hypothetical protein